MAEMRMREGRWRPLQTTPVPARKNRPLTTTGQGHGCTGHVLHRRAGRRHTHAHVVRWAGGHAAAAGMRWVGMCGGWLTGWRMALLGHAQHNHNHYDHQGCLPSSICSHPTRPPITQKELHHHHLYRCGTDYDNEKSRSCSSYFNMLYEVGRVCVRVLVQNSGCGGDGPGLVGEVAPPESARLTVHRCSAMLTPPRPPPPCLATAVCEDRHRGPHRQLDRPGRLPALRQDRHRLHRPPRQVGVRFGVRVYD